MTKFMTVMTVFGVFALNCYANDMASLQNISMTISQFRGIVTQLEPAYNKGQIKGNAIALNRLNQKASETLRSCEVVEYNFQEKAPEILARKQEARNRAILKAESLLDATDATLRMEQMSLVRNLENAKYCLGLTGHVRASIAERYE